VVVEAGEAVGLMYAPRTISVMVWKDEYPEGLSVDSLAVAFSGGGMRSAVLCVGWLQALEQIGVLNDVKYISTISGSSWTVGPMVYGTSTRKEFLGISTSPEDLTLSACEDLCSSGHSKVLAKSTFIEDMLGNALKKVPISSTGLVDGSSSVDWWSETVGESFFAPSGIKCGYNSTLPASDAGKAAEFAHALNGLADDIIPVRKDMPPFLIMNGSILVGGEKGCIPLEFTPMYFGTPAAYRDLDAVFVEPAGFCSSSLTKAQLPMVSSGSSVKVEVDRVVSIHEQSGISSSNIAQTHGDAMSDDQYEKLCFPMMQVFSNGMCKCVDGGSTDNTGILALLRRGCKKILAGIACNLSVAELTVEDANIHTLGTLAGLFGRQKSSTGIVDLVKDGDYNDQRHVFPGEKWDELISALRSRLQQGAGLVHKISLPVMRNESIAVKGGYTLTLVITISGDCKQFVSKLPAEVHDKMKQDALAANSSSGLAAVQNKLQGVGLAGASLATFPYIPVGQLRYSPRLLALMSQQARWTLLQSADDVRSLLQ